MKKALQYWFSLLLILLATSTVLVSCKAKQIPVETTSETTTDKTDFTSVEKLTEINKGIADELIWQLGQVKTARPDCDSITQAYLFDVLRYFNTQKTSGDNSYSFKFNELEKRLELLVNIAETKNSSKDSIKTVEVVKEIKTTREIPIKVPRKWWEKALMISGGVLLAWQLFKLSNYIRSKVPV